MTKADRLELQLLRQLEVKLREAVETTQRREAAWPEFIRTKGVKFWADALAKLEDYRRNGFKINGSGTPIGKNLQDRCQKAYDLERTDADAGTTGRRAQQPSAPTNFQGQVDEPHDRRQHSIRSTKMAKLQDDPKVQALIEKEVAKAVKAERKRVSDGIKNLELPEGTTARAAAIKKAVKAAVAAE